MGEDRQDHVAPNLWKAADLQTEKRERLFRTNYGTICGTNVITDLSKNVCLYSGYAILIA